LITKKPEGDVVPIEPDHPQIIRLERENLQLKDLLEQTRKKLTVAHRDQAMFVALSEVIRQEVTPLEPARINLAPVKEPGTDVDGVALLSDEHADEVITASGTWGFEAYDFGVFRCRLERWAMMIVKYMNMHLPRHRFQRLWVASLGDSVHGDIHGSGDRNHFPNTIKAALAVGDAEAQALQFIARETGVPLIFVRVAGNHSRRTEKKDYVDPLNNFDYLVSTQIATRLRSEILAGTISVHAPGAWSAFIQVRNTLWAMAHGDDVKGWLSLPWYGFDRKNNKIQALLGRLGKRIDYFVYGHYHTKGAFASAGAESIHNGAFPMTDPYTLEKHSGGNIPMQKFFVVDDDHGIILDIPIYLRDEKKEEQFRSGKYKPLFGDDLVIDQVDPIYSSGLNVISAA
jgi:hypothetical protein